MSDDTAKRLARSDVVDKLMTCAAASAQIEKMSDAQVADLLEEHVLAQTSMISMAYEVIEAAVERLRRAAPVIDAARRMYGERFDMSVPHCGADGCTWCGLRRALVEHDARDEEAFDHSMPVNEDRS
jgi:hypothetical protein